jgi:rhodanese-related sulfurtransferase
MQPAIKPNKLTKPIKSLKRQKVFNNEAYIWQKLRSTAMNKTVVLVREVGILLLASVALGLGYNVFSPKALPLVRSNTSVVASDSLISALAKISMPPENQQTSQTAVEASEQAAKASTVSAQNDSVPTTVPLNTQTTKSIRLNSTTSSQTQQKPEPVLTDQTASTQTSASPKALEIRFDQIEKLLANPDVLFIDARTTKEYTAGHIGNAINIFTPDFEQSIPRVIGLPRDKPIVAYCGGGACELSHELARHLLGLGFNHVFVYVGGWNEWQVKKSGVSN